LAVRVENRSPAERALRAEAGELRARLAEQARANAVLSEENAALRERVESLVERVGELERRLGQNPRNSDRPPSSEGYAKPVPRSRRKRTERRSGGQPGHAGRTLRRVSQPAERVVHRPAACSGWGPRWPGRRRAGANGGRCSICPRSGCG
jgi:transposase